MAYNRIKKIRNFFIILIYRSVTVLKKEALPTAMTHKVHSV